VNISGLRSLADLDAEERLAVLNAEVAAYIYVTLYAISL
jgi:hypothetical protein